MAMFKKFLHFIVSFPLVYDLVQLFFGAHQRKKVVQNQGLSFSNDPCVLDLGGGTGLYRELWPRDCRYICLDNDLVKLNGVKKTGPNDFLLLADVKKLPFKRNSMDIIFCNSIAHHLSDDVLEDLLAGSRGLLKNSGKFLFLDPVLRKESLFNRCLMGLDRGEYPRTQEVLSSRIKKHFNINHFEKFSYIADFVFYVCSKQ